MGSVVVFFRVRSLPALEPRLSASEALFQTAWLHSRWRVLCRHTEGVAKLAVRCTQAGLMVLFLPACVAAAATFWIILLAGRGSWRDPLSLRVNVHLSTPRRKDLGDQQVSCCDWTPQNVNLFYLSGEVENKDRTLTASAVAASWFSHPFKPLLHCMGLTLETNKKLGK